MLTLRYKTRDIPKDDSLVTSSGIRPAQVVIIII